MSALIEYVTVISVSFYIITVDTVKPFHLFRQCQRYTMI